MITVFLPCRQGSERVPNKNCKPFASVKGGLIEIKLKQLLKVNAIDRILLSTNDYTVVDIAQRISKEIDIVVRPDTLASSSTSTDELIKYVPEIITSGHVLWTHVTSPFLDENIYEHSISIYQDLIESSEYDSLMSVNSLQTFLWNSEGSVNYERTKEKWPRTQTIEELYEVNSGVFINSIDNYKKFNDRIGVKPYLYRNKGYSSFDIDWPDDFTLAEHIYKSLQ